MVNLNVLSNEARAEADRFALKVLELGDIWSILPLYLHMHTGILKRLFDEAAVPILFIVNLVGPTNIGKTLLMQLLFCLYDLEKHMANFTSTASGIERFFEQFHDAMAVLDDLSSITDKIALRVLERLIRQYCDEHARIVAARGGAGYHTADLCFGLTMTSEAVLEGGRQSSLVRMIHVQMTAHTLADDVVKEFKERILYLPKRGILSPLDIYATSFTRYVEQHFDEIVSFIASYTPPSIATQFRRHDAVYRIMATEAQIVLRYFVARQVFTAEKADEIFTKQWLPILQGLIAYNTTLGQQADPVRVYLYTLQTGIGQKLLPVADSRPNFEASAETVVGYWESTLDGIALYLDPSRSYHWVTAQLEKSHCPFPVGSQELLQMIANKGLSKVYERKGRKMPKPLLERKINGITVKFLVLKWDAVQRYLDS